MVNQSDAIYIVVLIILFFILLQFFCPSKKKPIDDGPSIEFFNPDNNHEEFESADTVKNRDRWDEVILKTIDPKIKDYHKEFVDNVNKFGSSTIRSFDIDETATNEIFTNFRGLRRPQYVPMKYTNKMVPDIDVSPMKNFRTLV